MLLTVALTATACGGTSSPAPEVFPAPLGAVAGTHVIGAAIPSVWRQTTTAPPPNRVPEWSALARVDGSVRNAISRFDRQARRAGLVRQPDDGVNGCVQESCSRRWSNRRGDLLVRVGPGGAAGARNVAEVEWGVHAATQSDRVRALATPRTGSYRPPSRGLGPGVEMRYESDDPCVFRIGVVRGDPDAVWRRWNRQDADDDEGPSVQARIDGRSVRQLVRTGFDYSVTVTMISGGGLRRPVLAGSFCS